jgi:hypothetical protein
MITVPVGLQDFGSAIHGVDTGNFSILIKA